MLESGELIISGVDKRDDKAPLRCRAVHTLTGSTRESVRDARIHVTGWYGHMKSTYGGIYTNLCENAVVRKRLQFFK